MPVRPGLTKLRRYEMKTSTAIIAGVAAVVLIAAAAYLIDIDQTREARLPSV